MKKSFCFLTIFPPLSFKGRLSLVRKAKSRSPTDASWEDLLHGGVLLEGAYIIGPSPTMTQSNPQP